MAVSRALTEVRDALSWTSPVTSWLSYPRIGDRSLSHLRTPGGGRGRPREVRQSGTFLANWEMSAASAFSTSRLISEPSGSRHAKTPWWCNKAALTSVGSGGEWSRTNESGLRKRLPVSSVCITLRREVEPQSARHDVGAANLGGVELSRSLLITSGAGEARTEPAVFDGALLSAGVGDFNLFWLSSVIPAGSMIVNKRPKLPASEWGWRLCVSPATPVTLHLRSAFQFGDFLLSQAEVSLTGPALP